MVNSPEAGFAHRTKSWRSSFMFLFDLLLRILKIGDKPKESKEKLVSDSNLETAKNERKKTW